MVEYLGKDRVHRYGSCGDGHEMPRGSFTAVASYKFYFAFENSVTEGYVTEKLVHTLSLGPVPVYLGAPDVYNITVTPSFINVKDFASPKALADYLVHLADHPDEYNAYHAWRTSPAHFTEEYLRMVADKLPSPEERKIHEDFMGHEHLSERRSLCCRLCNLDFLRRRVAERNFTADHWMKNSRGRGYINDEIFKGHLSG